MELLELKSTKKNPLILELAKQNLLSEDVSTMESTRHATEQIAHSDASVQVDQCILRYSGRMRQ